MTMDTVILLAQTLMTTSLAGWLLFGVLDNYLTPSLNRGFVGSVLTFERLKDMYPEDYARVSYREIKNPAIHRAVFVVIVAAETLVCTVLFVAIVMMFRALFGLVDPDSARTIALIGVLGFTLIWAAFLVFGNWFLLWMCHEWAQNSHFQLLLWGIATMVLLAVST
mgnify:CR=1 FL=1|jgi:predicted small integral membrane protein|tara:strand:- start:5 stop:502 length:498 start_codon:yes stop_codon:yes gene_type:complete